MNKPRVRASAVCREQGRLLIVRMRDPSSGVIHAFPPGGGLEGGETPAETAARETLEETGLRVKIDATSERVEHYPYRWDEQIFEVTTHYFMASLDEPFVERIPAVNDASYNLGAEWLPVSDALEAMPPIIGLPISAMLRRQAHAEWQRHRHFSGPAGTLLAVHGQFRAAAQRLLEIMRGSDSEGLGRAGRAFRPFAEMLHHHHQAEEAMVFPAMELRGGLASQRLVNDHDVLMKAIGRVERALVPEGDLEEGRAAATEFEYVLTTHLDREEELLVPFFLTMSPHEAWAVIQGD